MPEIEGIRSLLDLGAMGLLAIAVVGGYRGWYVFKWQWEALVKDRDEWKEMALRSINAAEKSSDVADHVVKERATRGLAAEVADGYQTRK